MKDIYKYTEDRGNIIIEGIEDFNLEHTLECGQCFNFEKISELEYIVVARGKMLHIMQDGNALILYGTGIGELPIWIGYFDLDRDYGSIKRKLIEASPELREAIEDKYGVHILNQEFTETLMSFIISQNKQIPHIKQIVRTLSERYGEYIGNCSGRDFYTFPTAEKLNEIGEQGYRECRAGFRAPYLTEAASRLNKGLNRESFAGLSYDEALEMLLKIRGVGNKVANCVLLFSLGYRSSFPVDVWVKRVMEEMYFAGKDTDKNFIMNFASERFGDLGGYAQQYLFYYRKTRK